MDFTNRPDLSGVQVLVVDDEVDLTSIIAEELRSQGAAVIEANDGKAARSILESEKISAIISDIRMPRFDGVQLLEYTRSCADYASVPFIIISGSSERSPEELIAKGATTVLTKPFELTTIISLIAKLTAKIDPSVPKKRDARHEVQLRIKFEILGSFRTQSSVVMNLSEGGAFVQYDGPPPPLQSVLKFEFEYSDGTISAEKDPDDIIGGHAMIRWRRVTTDQHISQGFGIEFLSPPANLIEFVQRLAAAPPVYKKVP